MKLPKSACLLSSKLREVVLEASHVEASLRCPLSWEDDSSETQDVSEAAKEVNKNLSNPCKPMTFENPNKEIERNAVKAHDLPNEAEENNKKGKNLEHAVNLWKPVPDVRIVTNKDSKAKYTLEWVLGLRRAPATKE